MDSEVNHTLPLLLGAHLQSHPSWRQQQNLCLSSVFQACYIQVQVIGSARTREHISGKETRTPLHVIIQFDCLFAQKIQGKVQYLKKNILRFIQDYLIKVIANHNFNIPIILQQQYVNILNFEAGPRYSQLISYLYGQRNLHFQELDLICSKV